MRPAPAMPTVFIALCDAAIASLTQFEGRRIMYRKDVQAREGKQQRIVRRRGVESIQRIRHPDTLAALLDNFARSAQWNIRCNSYRVPPRRASRRERARMK
jgi:hypothetical protein